MSNCAVFQLKRMDQVYRAGSCSWYIRQKQVPELETGDCKAEPCTSTDDFCSNPRKKSVEDDLSEYRLCGGGVSAKYLSNIITIAAIQEITIGLIFVTRENFFQNVQLLTLTICRILQYVPCFMALFGNYTNNALLVIPFMISQAIIGSYADIHSWILLCSDWKTRYPDSLLLASPLFFLVLPLFFYSVLLILILYVQYKAIQFVSVKKLSLNRGGVADETLVESLM